MASSLAGPRLFEVPPYVFANDKAGQLLAFYHLGSALSGHPNMLHGGIIAALLDECMGRACFPLLPHRIAITAALNIKYRVPVELDSVIMVKAETERIDGRKAWVKAKMEDSTTGMLLVEADALFLEPRNANAFGRMM
jgi:acyl-coenzyme A thioesterase PaaI-like protein